MKILCLISVALAILAVAQGYAIGAPQTACTSMAPNPGAYGHNAQPQTTTPPYRVTMDVPCNGYLPNKKYTMTLRPTNKSHQIEGFLCQVRKADGSDTTAIGMFSAFNPKGKAKHLACNSPKGAVTHKNNKGIHEFQTTWKAPSSIPNYNLSAFCTVVEHRDTYWLKVPSAFFTAAKSKTDNCVHGQCVALNAKSSRCRCEAGYNGPTCESVQTDTKPLRPPPIRDDSCKEFMREWASKLREWKEFFDKYQEVFATDLSPTNATLHDDDSHDGHSHDGHSHDDHSHDDDDK